MRYAVFSDIHANLEALEAVLAKIDELAQEEPIDQIWFLGDLVGYGPNPNECIVKLRERTDVIIAGNHDWAAVGKIDLDDFSEAARISANWTAEQLTEEHRKFLVELPEQYQLGECTLVHGSPYGPLWEYLTSEVLAERSFQHFITRYCLVGHTHVPIIFQQPDSVATTPTLPLATSKLGDTPTKTDEIAELEVYTNNHHDATEESDEEGRQVAHVASVSLQQTSLATEESAHAALEVASAHDTSTVATQTDEVQPSSQKETHEPDTEIDEPFDEAHELSTEIDALSDEALDLDADNSELSDTTQELETDSSELSDEQLDDIQDTIIELELEAVELLASDEVSSEDEISNAEEQLNQEIEELLALLGLSQSMVQTSNEMIIPPEGIWHAPEGFRAIVNPGGVGQPRDGDPRSAFLIYDTERGFTFYRVAYPFEKTQEKILKVGLPPYLAARLAYGR